MAGRSRSLIFLIVGGLVLTAGAVLGGLIAATDGGDDRPRIVLGDDDPSPPEPPPPSDRTPKPVPAVVQPAAPFEHHYLRLEPHFTTNIGGSGTYVRVDVSIVTRRGEPMIDALNEHKVAIRDRVLAALLSLDDGIRDRPDVRRIVADRIKAAIDGVLEERESVRGIDEVVIENLMFDDLGASGGAASGG